MTFFKSQLGLNWRTTGCCHSSDQWRAMKTAGCKFNWTVTLVAPCRAKIYIMFSVFFPCHGNLIEKFPDKQILRRRLPRFRHGQVGLWCACLGSCGFDFTMQSMQFYHVDWLRCEHMWTLLLEFLQNCYRDCNTKTWNSKSWSLFGRPKP